MVNSTKAQSLLFASMAVATIGTAIFCSSAAQAESISEGDQSFFPAACAVYHNGYTVKNLTGKKLVLKKMTQERDRICTWGNEPANVIEPGEEIDFSVAIDYQAPPPSDRMPLSYTANWWDDSRVIYEVESDSSRQVTVHANAGFYLQLGEFPAGYRPVFVDDKSSCKTFHGMCTIQKSEGRGTQTHIDLY